MPNPTRAQYDAFEKAYDHFNRRLFGGELPPLMLVFSGSSRSGKAGRKVAGHYIHQRWSDSIGAAVDELALNPDSHAGDELETAQTIVHEMCHHWQAHFGNPPRRCYHDRQWSNKMMEIGLQPTHDGTPEGKRVGQSMTDLPVPGGRFERAYMQIQGALLPFSTRAKKDDKTETKPKDASKTPYVRLTAEGGLDPSTKVWGRPGLALVDVASGLPMVQADEPEATMARLDGDRMALYQWVASLAPSDVAQAIERLGLARAPECRACRKPDGRQLAAGYDEATDAPIHPQTVTVGADGLCGNCRALVDDGVLVLE